MTKERGGVADHASKEAFYGTSHLNRARTSSKFSNYQLCGSRSYPSLIAVFVKSRPPLFEASVYILRGLLAPETVCEQRDKR